MHLIVSLYILASGIVLIASVPFDENLKSDLVEMRDSSEDPMAFIRKRSRGAQRDNPISLDIARLFVKARSRGYCLRRLSSLVPGTPSGFKGWKRMYHSGYVAAADRLYLFFKCATNKVVGRAKRVRREPSHEEPTFPPRPCINGRRPDSGSGDAMEDDPESEGSGDQSDKRRREERRGKSRGEREEEEGSGDQSDNRRREERRGRRKEERGD